MFVYTLTAAGAPETLRRRPGWQIMSWKASDWYRLRYLDPAVSRNPVRLQSDRPLLRQGRSGISSKSSDTRWKGTAGIERGGAFTENHAPRGRYGAW